ncbi:MAG: hypothetical protein AB8G99_24880 [Planctomycetaceae bacterium]
MTESNKPINSRVRIIEPDSTRLVISIPAGGPQSKSLGTMALFWNGFVTFGTVFLIFGSTEVPLLLLGLPFLTIFLIVGWYMAGSWVAMRFTRSDVLIGRQELGVKKILFGFKRMEVAECSPETKARLVELFRQDGDPVFRIRVNGVDQSLTFGSALSREEKNWLVQEINVFLGQQCGEPVRSKSKGSELPFEAVSPDELPDYSIVKLIPSRPGELAFETPVAPHHPMVTGLIVLLTLVSLLWAGVGVWRLWYFEGLVSQIVGWVFAVGALLPLLSIVVLLVGRTRVTINEREFATRVGVGPLGYTVRRPTSSAERIVFEATVADPSHGSLATTVVQMGSSKMLAAWALVKTCEEVAGLVRSQFDNLGIETMEQLEAEAEGEMAGS